MKKFTCSVRMDNAAFDDSMGGRDELAHILAELALRVADTDSGTLRDSNGNTVGTWAVKG